MIKVIGVRFRQAGKIYYFSPGKLKINRGDHVIVETARGVEYGYVVVGNRDVEDDRVVQPLKPVIRMATEQDDQQAESIEQMPLCPMLPEHQDIIDDRKDAGQHDEQQVSGQWRAKDRDLSADRPEPRQQADDEHGQRGHSAHIMEHLLLQPAFTLIAFAMIMLSTAHQFIFFHPYYLLPNILYFYYAEQLSHSSTVSDFDLT